MTSELSSQIISLSIDANDPERLASFWAEALGWTVGERRGSRLDEVPVAPTDNTRFGLLFLPVPDAKAGQNRLHLDLTTTSSDDQVASAARLVALGGRHIDVGQGPHEDHIVLADPEGNEFCVLRRR